MSRTKKTTAKLPGSAVDRLIARLYRGPATLRELAAYAGTPETTTRRKLMDLILGGKVQRAYVYDLNVQPPIGSYIYKVKSET